MGRVAKISIILGLFFFLFSTPTFALYTEQQSSPPPYLPDQIIVKFKPSDTPEKIRVKALEREKKKKSGVAGFLQYQIETFTFKLKNEKPPEEKLADLKKAEAKAGTKEYKTLPSPGKSPAGGKKTLGVATDPFSSIRVVKISRDKSVQKAIQAYKDLPEVETAFYDRIFTIQATPNDPRFSSMWGLKKIQMEKAWDISKGSKEVVIAVIDTGADYNHPDLKDNLLPGYNALIGGNNAQDDHGHGTHVSGTIGALTNNNQGVAGINWEVNILPIKALDSRGSGPLSALVTALRYVANNAQEKNIVAVNMSLGDCRYGGRGRSGCSPPPGQGDSCTEVLNEILDQIYQNGVNLIAAAGNSNADTSLFAPASCDNVIAVGATNQNDRKASFSNYGNRVTLSAPGVAILSTVPGGGYRSLQGTSMASPHVAGVVGLMYAVNNSLSPEEVRQILSNPSNLDPIQSSVPMGAGRLNALKILQALQKVSDTTPFPTTQPTTSPTSSPSSSCKCTQENICSDSCNFNYYQDISYSKPLNCEREKGIKGETPNTQDKDAYCQRPERPKGDADGDGKVDELDYFYYVRAVNGGQIPKTVNPDFNGDGKVSPTDRKIILKSLR